MPRIISGDAGHGRGQYAIVVSRYNETVTSRLLEAALETLASAGIADQSILVAWVPGAWELSVVARQLANGSFDAVICLGAVIRGETTHDQYINHQVSHTLGRIADDTGKPILFGLLTCQNLEQALQRSGGNVGNKGAECATAALEMVDLLAQISPSSRIDRHATP